MNKTAKEVLWAELVQAFGRVDLAWHIAWSDTRTRYRRSVLGPFWLVLGTGIGIGALGFVWTTLFANDPATFVPSLAIGLVVWYLLSAGIVEAAAVFYSHRDLLLNIPVSSLLVSLLLLLKQLVNFGHNFVVVIVVLILFPQHVGAAALLAVPGLLLVALNLLWIIQLVGYVGARYRDLAPLLAAVMPPMFFVTPVLFQAEQLGDRRFIADFNPFTYWLALVRDPLMGIVPPATTWGIVLIITAAGWAAALALTASKRHRLAYWVN